MIKRLINKFLYRNGHKRNSPKWAFLEGFQVPDIENPENVYLARIRVVSTPWFSIMLHRLNLPDSRAILHNHPWSFLSVVLRGGYTEFVPPTKKDIRLWDTLNAALEVDSEPLYVIPRHISRINWKPFNRSYHWISELDRTPTWTLVFTGRRKRVWGYLEPDGTYYDFYKHEINNKFEQALEVRGGGGDLM